MTELPEHILVDTSTPVIIVPGVDFDIAIVAEAAQIYADRGLRDTQGAADFPLRDGDFSVTVGEVVQDEV